MQIILKSITAFHSFLNPKSQLYCQIHTSFINTWFLALPCTQTAQLQGQRIGSSARPCCSSRSSPTAAYSAMAGRRWGTHSSRTSPRSESTPCLAQ